MITLNNEKKKAISVNEKQIHIWGTREYKNMSFTVNRITSILLIFLASIFCSEEGKASQYQKKIYVWRYYGYKTMGLESLVTNQAYEALRLYKILYKPFEAFKLAYKNEDIDQAKIQEWFLNNINSVKCRKIIMQEDLKFLYEKYKDDENDKSIEEKILQFINEKIIDENDLPELIQYENTYMIETLLKNRLNDYIHKASNLDTMNMKNFFQAITTENLEKYIYFAEKWIFEDIDTNLNIVNHDGIDETAIELISVNDVIGTLKNIGDNAIKRYRNNKNENMNPMTILKVDMDFILYNYAVFYKALIKYCNDIDLSKKFKREHDSKIIDFFDSFEKEYKEIVNRCIVKNENIYIYFPIKYHDLETFIKEKTIYYFIDRGNEINKKFFKKTREKIKEFYKKFHSLVNIKHD